MQALGEAVVACLAEEVDKISTVRAKIIKMQVRPHLLFKVGCTRFKDMRERIRLCVC